MIDPDDPKFKEIALKLIKAKGSDGKPLVIYGKTRITHPTGGFIEKNGMITFIITNIIKPPIFGYVMKHDLTTPLDRRTKFKTKLYLYIVGPRIDNLQCTLKLENRNIDIPSLDIEKY